jgi:coproporphyrinogen III oxidase-like Fe-S oxidoreductase
MLVPLIRRAAMALQNIEIIKYTTGPYLGIGATSHGRIEFHVLIWSDHGNQVQLLMTSCW